MRGRPLINPHIIAVIENEWAQLLKNRVVIATTLTPPFLLVALALCMLLVGSAVDQGNVYSAGLAAPLPPSVSGGIQLLSGDRDDISKTLLSPFLLLFQLVPLVVPITIASYSIVGEKQNRSLEALLATPVRTWELLFAKAFAAAVPAVMATWYSFAVFALASKFLVSDHLFSTLILGPTWTVSIVLLAPVFTMLAVGLAIIISSRARDAHSAQQLGSLVVMPLMAALAAQVVGIFEVTLPVVFSVALFVAALDVIVLALAVRLFNRESILTSWR